MRGQGGASSWYGRIEKKTRFWRAKLLNIMAILPITSFDGPLLGFKTSRGRGEDEKLRQEKAKMRKKTKH